MAPTKMYQTPLGERVQAARDRELKRVLKELVKQGLTLDEIAAALGTTRQTVSRHIDRLGGTIQRRAGIKVSFNGEEAGP